MPQLKQGDQAPVFTLQDQNENQVGLADFKGNMLFVYFYPKANTPG